MRLIRSAIIVLFVLVCAATLHFHLTVKPDTAGPSISCSVSQIDAPCAVTEKELLNYVSASDSKDGDLTGEVFIESISPFIEEGVSVVTFCVGDSDGNVSKKSLRLNYTDYEKPKLVLHDDLVFATGDTVNLSGAATVTDSFDGDITNRLYTLVSGDEAEDGSEVLFKVTNSKGYTYEWKFKILRDASNKLSISNKISLKENSLFVSCGDEKPDFKKLVSRITVSGIDYDEGVLVVDEGKLNMNKSGTYDVWFYLYSPGSKKNRKLMSVERLIVVCEENKTEEKNK